MAMKKLTTVSSYIASYPKPAQVMMRQIRRTIKAAAPTARETISYRMPFYEYRIAGYKGQLVYFAGYANHIGLYIFPRNIPATLTKQMKPYQHGRATLRFPIGTKTPLAMVKRLVRIRMREIDQVLKNQINT